MRNRGNDIAQEVDALRTRGVEAVTDFFQRDRNRLQKFVKHRTDKRLNIRLDTEDVLQDTYIVVQNRYIDFIAKPTVPFYVWMRTIASQVLIDLHRKHLHLQRRNINREVSLYHRLSFRSTSVPLRSRLTARDASPIFAAIRAEQIDYLMRSIEKLNLHDREILVLRHIEQLTNGEVAQVLGIEKSAATKRYVRALKHLRTALNAFGNE